ncbi:MAG: membrane protein insertion efficiency factor YidD [Jaaginema sp. PMC 1079.18]|nr:membrane protein insertion efficiency factor YidD [Jaaginema sp. PMC 1080.18]MEC4853113.1 membrane protein insertion efficiency factor YidD [Jaaginema sp. PMC 1079.18]MEC4867947.1 membrane protein insertion efficiency factor YidD [Jaaginema sp. PMC 1078.18]
MKTISFPQGWRIIFFWSFLAASKTILTALAIALEKLAQSRHRFIAKISQKLKSYAQYNGVYLITFYQKYISPYKGFACAHRVLYKKDSCSQYVKTLLIEQDLQSAIALSHQRFRDCKKARLILQSKQLNSEDFEKESPKRKPRKNHFCSEALEEGFCDFITLPFDCADTDFDCIPDCGDGNFDCTPDCGDCGSSIDCTPSCDCG